MTIGDTVSRFLRYDADIAFRSRARTLLEFLDPQDGDLVLDAGCGLGFYLVLLSKLTPCTTVGIEVNNSRLRSAGAASPGSLLAEGDITRLPFPDSTFDKVLSTEVLEHLPDDVAALEELFRVLRPGGVAAFSVPYKNYPFLWDPLNKVREALRLGHFVREPWSGIWTDHQRLYTRSELRRKLEQCGLEVTDVRLQTRWSWPFAHLFVYGAGKAMVGRRRTATDRARSAFWGDPPRSMVLRWAIRAFTAADRLNRPQVRRGPAVSLCVRAMRPPG